MRNDYRHMMIDHFISKMKNMDQERKLMLKKIKSRKAALAYKERVGKVIKKAFSPSPEKTPLNSKTTGIIRRKGYRIEKIIFESRPKCLVTANLYIPEKFDPPFPAVIGTCGHSMDGKGEPKYQEFSQRLVHNGFMVLIYDPFNQGERDQYTVLPKNSILRRGCCAAHNMMGKQLQLVDEFFGAWRLWDGIRALDYLCEREEVDKSFLGVTGNSGGGTMTTWLWPNETRFTAAAPSCFITPFRYNLENELPQDIEQCPPGILKNHVEIADFFIARCPDPVILLGQNYDYFDIRGFKEICDEVKKFYEIFDAEENFAYFIGNNTHGYYPDAQRAMVKFFCKIAKKKLVNDDPEIHIEKPETLFATKHGNVIKEGSKPIYKFIAKRAQELENSRVKRSKHNIEEEIRKLLKIPQVEIPHYRVLRPDREKNINISRYAIETEPDILAILKPVSPAHLYNLEPEEKINLVLPDYSSEDEIKEKRDFLPPLPEYFLDVRGTGESMPEETKYFFRPYGYDFIMDVFHLMFDETYLGKRIYDVLTSIELLKSKGCKEIVLYGNRQGAIIGLFVSFFCADVKKVFLKNLPESFKKMAAAVSNNLPSVNFPKGILKITDIPEMLEIIKKEKEVITL